MLLRVRIYFEQNALDVLKLATPLISHMQKEPQDTSHIPQDVQVCYGLNANCPQPAHVSEYLIFSCLHCF